MSIIDDVRNAKQETPGITWEDLARRFGYSTGEAMRSAYRRAKASDEEYEEDEELIEFFHEERDVPDWRELAQKAVGVQKTRKAASPHIRSTSAAIKTNGPVGIVFSGDWHLGDGSTRYEDWLKDIEAVIQHPKLFLVDLGDDRQNVRAFKDLSSVLSQALSPQEQALLMRGLVNELTEKDKLLCKVDGNHDVEFDERIFGEALQWYLLEKMRAPRFTNKGLMFLEVGTERYSVYVFHKSRFRSIYRAAHGAFREWQFGYPADIVAGGHDHTPAFEMLPNYLMAREAGMGFGGMTFLIKCGTYQESKYGWKYFHNGGRPEAIVVVLWPDQHKMQAFLSIQDAVRFLDSYDAEGDDA